MSERLIALAVLTCLMVAGNGVRVALVAIDGGGHTWPQGFQFAPRGRVGLVSADFSANELIWEFASAAP